MEKPLYQLPDDDRTQDEDRLRDDNPLYNLDDNDDIDDDPSRPYWDSGDDDDDDGNDDEEEDRPKDDKSRKSWTTGLLFRIMFSPAEGWKAMKRSRITPEDVASKCFYPLVALASLSEFSALFHHTDRSLTSLLISAVVTFITFFFGYFLTLLAGGIVLPECARDVLKKPIGKNFVMMCMSTLALFYFFYRLIPILDPILVFLPLWTIYMVFRASKMLRFPKDKENKCSVLLSMLIIGLPVACNWVFTEFLPL